MTEREKAAADATLAALPTGVIRRMTLPVTVTAIETDEAAGTWSMTFDVDEGRLIAGGRDIEERTVYADGSYSTRLV